MNIDVNKYLRRKVLCIGLSSLLLLTVFPTVIPSADETVNALDIPVLEAGAEVPYINKEKVNCDARHTTPMMKIQPCLRKMINNHLTGNIKTVVVTDNVQRLAQLLSDYDFNGLIGTKNTTTDRFVPVVLELPIESLYPIAELEGVIGVYEYQSPQKNIDKYPGEESADYCDISRLGGDPVTGKASNPVKPLMKDAVSTHHAQEAWSNGFTGQGINIAIPDTGIDFGHPDLQGTQARVSNSSSPYYGWPIAFDQVSMSDFLRTGSANDTWYVNTSYNTTATITVADQIIDTESEWVSATEYFQSWSPKVSGSMESNTVTGFTPGKEYCFAIRARDEANNIAGISNNAISTAGSDVLPPSTITDLMVESGPEHGSVWLNWTAPGDDGMTGTVDNYIVKYSTLPIPNNVCFDFIERDYIININGNIPGGGIESRVISALPAGETFYFSIIAEDETGNEGTVSNCPSPVQVQNDITPPAAISDLTVTTGLQHREVNLTWTAPGDDGMVGTSIYYWIKYSTSPITTQAEFDAALPVSESPTPQTSGSTENFVLKNTLTAGLTYYFAIKAEDEAGNYGAMSTGPSLSAVAMEDTDAPGQILDLNAVPGPNHATVRLFWNATGDDAAVGQATKYIIKYHTADDYGSALTYQQLLVDTWTPKTSGEAEDFILESVMGGFIAPNTLYYFWVQAIDDGSNVGAVPTSASVTSTEDTTPPEAINDLQAYTGNNHRDIILTWTAPHEDGGSGGACVQYYIKYSTTPIIDEATFNAATQLSLFITPKSPGSIENHTVIFPPGIQQYFAIKAIDEAFLFGPLNTNLPVSAQAKNDVTPPSTINDLVAFPADENGQVILEWTAPGDDGATGTASLYIVKYREAFSEYRHVPYEKNQTLDDIWYNVTDIQSVSGMYRLGVHPDTNLAFLISDPVYPVMSDYSRVLLVDSSTAGVYDTVYVDLDHDQDFSDEKACFKGDEISWADTDDDGMADRSGGMIYFIANNIDPIPYSDAFSSKYGIDNIIPENGTIVCFTGEFNMNENHGTLCASSIAAQGRIEDGLIVGMAPQSKLISISNFYQAYSIFDCLDFTVEGYDGVPGTGDEAEIVSNSYGWTYDNDGWDFTSRYMDNLITQYAQGQSTFVVTSMDDAGGYGSLSSPAAAPGVITCGAATSKLYRVDPLIGFESYDGGPNPAYGDVAPFSSRGPSALGRPKPDVMGVGAFAYGDSPLNQEDIEAYGYGWELWNGPGLSTPISAGALALIFDAYCQAHSFYPSSEIAKKILMSGCDDMNNDVLAQGAGFVNADRSTKIANDLDGISTSTPSWNPGDFRGIEYEAFAKLMYPGYNISTQITIENHNPTINESVVVSDAVFQRTGETNYSLDLAPDEHSWNILNETGIYDRNGTKFGEVNSNLWNNADLIKVTAYANFTDLDTDGDGFLDTNYWLELHDWTDVNGNGMFDGDLVPDPYEGGIGFYERNRMVCDWPGPTTVLESRIYDPSQRTHDGLLIWNREIYSTNASTWQVKCEFYQKTDWDWLTTDKNSMNINAGTTNTFNATISVPSNAGIGLYEGAIYLSKENEIIGEVIGLDYDTFDVYNELVFNTTPMDAQLAHGNVIPATFELWKNGTFFYNNESMVYNTTGAEPLNGDGDFWFYLPHGNITGNLTLYYYEPGSWDICEDFVIDNVTGNVTVLWGAPDPGWEFYAYYNYSGIIHLVTPADYSLDSLTGEIILTAPLSPGELLLANYTWFIPVNTGQLQHGDVVPGSYKIYKNAIEMSAIKYTIDLKSGQITFLDYLIPSDIITADYTYRTERSTIPVLVNVAANSLPFTFGGNSGTFDLYDNNRVYGGSLESNDWRYYFVDIPDTTVTGAGHKLLIDVNWSNTPSDIDVLVYGRGVIDQFSLDNETRYGPYTLEYKGGSEAAYQFYTTTGTSREVITAELTTGLNIIMLRNTILNGSANYEEFSGTVGTMYIEPYPIDIFTDKLSGKVPINISSNIDWVGVETEIFGSEVENYTNQEVWQDDTDWSNYSSFEEQLASGNTTIPISVTDASRLIVHIWGYPDAPDLDLGIFLDGKDGNPIDGETQVGEFVIYCADGDADEEITLFFPEDGTYLIKIFGFTLLTQPGHYDMQVTRVSPMYAPHFYVEDLNSGFLPANTTRTFNLTWNLPGTSPNGVYSGDLFVGPLGAAFCCQDPITLVLNRSMIPVNISLSEGWNLISLPLIQTNESINDVLWNINGKWDYIQTYDALDTDHWKTNATFKPDQLNDLKTLNHMMGFWINITETNVILTVNGNIPNTTLIPLYAGWNLVGYPTLNISMSVGDALWGTGADRVEVCNTSEPYHLREVAPTYVMKPGEGYWIHVPADTIWIIDW